MKKLCFLVATLILLIVTLAVPTSASADSIGLALSWPTCKADNPWKAEITSKPDTLTYSYWRASDNTTQWSSPRTFLTYWVKVNGDLPRDIKAEMVNSALIDGFQRAPLRYITIEPSFIPQGIPGEWHEVRVTLDLPPRHRFVAQAYQFNIIFSVSSGNIGVAIGAGFYFVTQR